MMMKILAVLVILSGVAVIMLNSCATIPDGAVAVQPFDQERYLGKWYEIARMDFRFERDLKNVTAEYSLKENGTFQVVNRGFNYVTGEWKHAVGKAKAAGVPGEARLKVSFFGPFYSGYNVIALDGEYKYALVAGANLRYLWLLSRETTMPETIKQSYLEKARTLGYKTDALIWTKHD